ncbi:HEPN domain-containing protein [Candidatus Woesearchaeota archaeon]|nr:HEPN domain-containing protein [Candidatus Woesearchaeota archaeon]
MKRSDFLKKIHKEGKLELVEPSQNISKSYIEKSNKSLKSAHILIKNNLYEDSVSKSYYAIYYCLLALLFRTGIKCENHTASIIIFKELFDKNTSSKINPIKKTRINTDYSVENEPGSEETKRLYKEAENIILDMKIILNNINETKINKIREDFKKLI